MEKWDVVVVGGGPGGSYAAKTAAEAGLKFTYTYGNPLSKKYVIEANGSGTAFLDYDNDGRPDLFITAVGLNHLFHNEGGGQFRDVTAEAGVAGVTNQWSTACAWLDFDNDGDLDLFVGNYVKWSRAIDFEVGYKLVGIGRAYGPPMNFQGTYPLLYRNDGGMRFRDVTKEAGLAVPRYGMGVAIADYDADGDPDVYLTALDGNLLFTTVSQNPDK